jgi:predicted nucleotidyltransferase
MKPRSAEEMVRDNLIVKHFAGSMAYGTNLPTSDTDIRGIFLADSLYYRSPWLNVEEYTAPQDEDTKYYELSKFMKLLSDQNPNIVESLWVHPSDIIRSTPAYELLRGNRDKLLSSKVAFTYSGYAHEQLKRIKGHSRWLNNPKPVKAPSEIEFISLVQDFTPEKVLKYGRKEMEMDRLDHRLVPYGGNLFGMYRMRGSSLFDDNGEIVSYSHEDRPNEMPLRIIKLNLEEFERAKTDHTNYWNWKNNRNKGRSELEEKFGYDTKHAMHLIRLLRTGYEILDTGQIHVKRPDAAELLEIRSGKYTYDELLSYAELLENEIKKRYKTTGLPKSVDIKFATKLVLVVQDIVWSK